MTKLLTQTIRQTLLRAVVTGIAYPLLVTGLAKAIFPTPPALKPMLVLTPL